MILISSFDVSARLFSGALDSTDGADSSEVSCDGVSFAVPAAEVREPVSRASSLQEISIAAQRMNAKIQQIIFSL